MGSQHLPSRNLMVARTSNGREYQIGLISRKEIRWRERSYMFKLPQHSGKLLSCYRWIDVLAYVP